VRKKYTHKSKHTPQRDVILEINPQDTMYLLSGKYYIEAKLRVFDEDGYERVFTVLPKKMLYLEE
jgi:23S rRNA A2030 N6-methylase RlmJ